jgi:hypothetical protein
MIMRQLLGDRKGSFVLQATCISVRIECSIDYVVDTAVHTILV